MQYETRARSHRRLPARQGYSINLLFIDAGATVSYSAKHANRQHEHVHHGHPALAFFIGVLARAAALHLTLMGLYLFGFTSSSWWWSMYFYLQYISLSGRPHADFQNGAAYVHRHQAPVVFNLVPPLGHAIVL